MRGNGRETREDAIVGIDDPQETEVRVLGARVPRPVEDSDVGRVVPASRCAAGRGREGSAGRGITGIADISRKRLLTKRSNSVTNGARFDPLRGRSRAGGRARFERATLHPPAWDGKNSRKNRAIKQFF
jgi:hypothetical protein